jgi:X-Pro dipeptidyl-peptidase
MRSTLVRVALAVALLSAPLALAVSPTSASTGAEVTTVTTPYVLKDGKTQPVYSYQNAIRESVWVKAPDGNGDGQKDLVTVDIVRPRELDGKAKIPVIIDPSPYYLCCGRGNEGETKTYDGNGNPLKMPLFYDNYFEPRGYAVAEIDMAGTARSSGCADEGASSDIGSIKAVIDWLNGRAGAVDIKGNAVKADWTNGSAALIGKSYDGTLAQGVAATGVEGLKTIVPISAISSWYDYDRSQGLPFYYDYPAGLSQAVEGGRTRSVDCSAINAAMNRDDGDETGAYTKFWSQRDYRATPPPSADQVTASMFISHGMQDTNVKTVNFGRWYKLMKKNHVVTKVWLSRLGHVDPFDCRRAVWVDTLHRWFDSQLMGIRNGILKEPRVDVETTPGTWVTSDTWPVSDNNQVMTFHADGSLTTGAAETGHGHFVNNPNQSEATAVAKGSNPNRLLYVSGSLKSNLRISGEPTVDLTITPDGSVGQVGVALVDYGTEIRVRDDGDGSRNLGTSSCWGKSVSYDDSCYIDVTEDTASFPLAVLARGWARLTGHQTNTLTVDLAYNDVVVQKGDQLGLVIFGASPDWLATLDGQATPYQVDLKTSSLTLPIVGGLSTAPDAGDLSQVPATLPRGTVPGPGGKVPLPF